MKRILIFILTIFIMISPSFVVFANDSNFDEEEYKSCLNNYDLSCFDKLDSDTYNILEALDLNEFDYNKIIDFSLLDFVKQIFNMIKGSAKTPLKACSLILFFVILSSLIQSFKSTLRNDEMNSLFSTVSALVISIILIANVKNTLALSVSTISVCADFIFAFFPAFCVIVATSGNTATAFSSNTLLLFLSQFLNFISKNIFLPLTNSFLAIGICSGIRSEIHLNSIISLMKKYITTTISICSVLFVSVLSIKTAVTSQVDILGLRSMKFAINSVVPVIGSAISEGLLSIQTYSSLIKTSVGIVGIIAVAFVFLPSILEVLIWRFFLSICSAFSEVFGDNSVSLILKAFKDTFLIVNVILILSMVTTIISIGILIASKGSV